MAINPRLELKQGQTLTMTTQLQQAIKLLQLSNLELDEFVENEIEQNPFLERDEGKSPAQENEDKQEDTQGNENDLPKENDRPLDTGDTLEEGGYDYTSSTYAGTGAGGNSRFEDLDYNLENTVADRRSLRDHLMNQIQ